MTLGRRLDIPSLFFTAGGGSAKDELHELADAVSTSTLPDREAFADEAPTQWNAALRLLAEILPEDSPSVVVIDEVPYPMSRIDAFEGMLQRAWDRSLSRKPVLLLLVGSDLSMMAALNSYERPFHQRGREMVVGPLNPADLGEMLQLTPAAAIDATLITGGLPLICREWPPGASIWEFLGQALDNPISALLVSAERSLCAEFPDQAMGRQVLQAIGLTCPRPRSSAATGRAATDVEIDLVGADRGPVAKKLLFLGSIKWLENAVFDEHDLAALHKHRAAITDDAVPLVAVPLVAVSRNGVSCHGLQATYGPEELLAAWHTN